MRALYASEALAVISSLDFGSCKKRANFFGSFEKNLFALFVTLKDKQLFTH